jgi:2-polyprenyl-3-methyl-5-hydroxy-6-metoxy-1,4-benzoquinol methylase
MNLEKLFSNKIEIYQNLIFTKTDSRPLGFAQEQTKDVFSEKWSEVEDGNQKEELYSFQKEWFLDLYGFSDEEALKLYLSDKKIIVDAGCGLGYKSAWLAKLAPESIVIGIDISESIQIASKNYEEIPNLFFYQSDIADTKINIDTIDFVICDQVIMHTENPDHTFKHLSSIVSNDGEFACYVYRKKALPRELLDDYFRKATFDIPNDKLWEMSAQLTELGKRLSELDIKFESPDIPVLGIKGGTYDIQRFIYWNFLKCFWREDWGKEMCDATNFDWYAPSNAKRYSKSDFEKMIFENKMEIISFHEEDACYSGRFKK